MTAADLLNTKVPGQVTEAGVKENVSTALAYTTSWIGGNACIPLNYLMEDAATAEIARVQLWQWTKYAVRLENGLPITPEYIDKLVDELAPGIKKLAPGIKEDDLKITTAYLKKQVRLQWPSEFLTSDMMPYLAIRDGVEAKFQRSAL